MQQVNECHRRGDGELNVETDFDMHGAEQAGLGKGKDLIPISVGLIARKCAGQRDVRVSSQAPCQCQPLAHVMPEASADRFRTSALPQTQ